MLNQSIYHSSPRISDTDNNSETEEDKFYQYLQGRCVGVASVSTAVVAVSPTTTSPSQPSTSHIAIIAGTSAGALVLVIVIVVVYVAVRHSARSMSVFSLHFVCKF